MSAVTPIAPQRAARIATQLVELIEIQKLKPNDKLPSERALAELLAVSRPSLREALHILQAQGFVQIKHGQGTFVQEPIVAQELRDEREALLAQQKPPEGAKPSPNPSKVTPTNAGQDDSTARAMALFTQTMTAVANQMASGAAGQNNGEKPTKPLPPHLKGCKDPAKCKCAGCGNVWARNRPIPCFYACKFMEHPAYNQKYFCGRCGGVSVQSLRTIEHSAREQGERRKAVENSLVYSALAAHFKASNSQQVYAEEAVRSEWGRAPRGAPGDGGRGGVRNEFVQCKSRRSSRCPFLTCCPKWKSRDVHACVIKS